MDSIVQQTFIYGHCAVDNFLFFDKAKFHLNNPQRGKKYKKEKGSKESSQSYIQKSKRKSQ